MASIKLDPNKAYRVNVRLLEASGPSAVSVEIGEKPAGTPPPGQPEPSCSGFGSPTHKATGGQVFINQMQREQIVSIEFSSAFFGSDGMRGTALALTSVAADVQCVVSRCPNDFTSIGPQCSFIRRGTQGTWEFFLSDTPNTSRCTLPTNTSKVYVNIRQVKIPAAGVSAPPYNAPFCSTSSGTSCWLPSCPPGENCSFDVNASQQTGIE